MPTEGEIQYSVRQAVGKVIETPPRHSGGSRRHSSDTSIVVGCIETGCSSRARANNTRSGFCITASVVQSGAAAIMVVASSDGRELIRARNYTSTARPSFNICVLERSGGRYQGFALRDYLRISKHLFVPMTPCQYLDVSIYPYVRV